MNRGLPLDCTTVLLTHMEKVVKYARWGVRYVIHNDVNEFILNRLFEMNCSFEPICENESLPSRAWKMGRGYSDHAWKRDMVRV